MINRYRYCHDVFMATAMDDSHHLMDRWATSHEWAKWMNKFSPNSSLELTPDLLNTALNLRLDFVGNVCSSLEMMGLKIARFRKQDGSCWYFVTRQNIIPDPNFQSLTSPIKRTFKRSVRNIVALSSSADPQEPPYYQPPPPPTTPTTTTPSSSAPIISAVWTFSPGSEINEVTDDFWESESDMRLKIIKTPSKGIVNSQKHGGSVTNELGLEFLLESVMKV